MTDGKILAAFVCGIAAVAAPALADTRDDVMAAVARCGVIHDDRVWLDCVYGAQQPMRAKLGLSPAPELQQRLVPGPNVAPPQAMASAPARPVRKPGFFEGLVTSTDLEKAPRMASYRFEKGGAFVVALENGQEFRQTNVEGGSPDWNRQPSMYRVVVTQGMFGNYNLRTNDSPRVYQVKRIR